MKYFSGGLKALRTILVVGLLTASLALNVSMFIGGAYYTAASSLVERVTGFQTTATRHTVQVARLTKDLEDERSERRRLEARLASVSAKVTRTTNRVTSRVSRSVVREVASMPGEALPWFGVAAIAGVTVLEVNDLCATLEDMEELEREFQALNAGEEAADTVCSIEVPTAEDLWATIKSSPSLAWESVSEGVASLPDLADMELPDIEWSTYWNSMGTRFGEYYDASLERSARIWIRTVWRQRPWDRMG